MFVLNEFTTFTTFYMVLYVFFTTLALVQSDL